MTTPQIFLAYCRGNYVEAEQLHDELLEAGYSVWWDHDILPGQDWKFEIRDAMQDCSVFLLCLSKEGVKRKRSGIYSEIFDAISIYRESKPGEISLIPVRFSECKIPPIEIDGTRTLNRLQCLDLFPPEKRDQRLERLLVALRKHFPASQKSDFVSTPSVSELPDKDGVEDNLADAKTVVALEITVRGNFDKFSDEDQPFQGDTECHSPGSQTSAFMKEGRSNSRLA